MGNNVQCQAILNETISATCSEIPLRARCKSLCSQDKRQSENRKVSKTVRAWGWKDEQRACRIDFSPQSGLQTPTSSLGWSFWSLGWEGRDAFGRVLFDSGGSLPLIPPYTHTGAHAQTSASSPSAWSAALTPPGGRGIVIHPSLPPTNHTQEREMRMLGCSLPLFINFPKQISGCVFVVVEAIWFA